MQLPVWVWKCTPAAKPQTLHVIRPRHVYRGIGHVVRRARIYVPTHALFATAMTCAFVPLATAVAPAALPAFVPVAAAPIYFAPEGLPEGAGAIGSWRTAAVPPQSEQTVSSSSGPASGNVLAFSVPSPTNLSLPVVPADFWPEFRAQLVLLDVLAVSFPVVATPILAAVVPNPAMANPIPGVLPGVPTEIDEPGSAGLFALSLLWMAATRLRKPLRKKDTSRVGKAGLDAMVFA
jgi:hypothetical protein